MMENLKILSCNMGLKDHFLHSYMDFSPQHLGAFSQEQGERFRQDMKEIERRYQGKFYNATSAGC